MNEGNTDIETGKPGTDPAGTAETGTDSGKETPKAGTQAPAAMTPETVTALVQKMLQDFTAKQQAQQSEAEKLAGMNGTQRLEYERDSYKDQPAFPDQPETKLLRFASLISSLIPSTNPAAAGKHHFQTIAASAPQTPASAGSQVFLGSSGSGNGRSRF